MFEDDEQALSEQQVDQNLKRAYTAGASGQLPEQFQRLLASMREDDKSRAKVM